jgi:hypothetical protein
MKDKLQQRRHLMKTCSKEQLAIALIEAIEAIDRKRMEAQISSEQARNIERSLIKEHDVKFRKVLDENRLLQIAVQHARNEVNTYRGIIKGMANAAPFDGDIAD